MYLRDVCVIQPGLGVRGALASVPHGRPALQQSDALASGPLDLDALIRIPDPAGRYLVEAGDVVFRSRSQYPGAWIVPGYIREPLVAVAPLFILRPSRSLLDPAYLAWSLNHVSAQLYFRQWLQGQTVQMISRSVLEATQIWLPPIAQQREIAAVSRLADREQKLQRRLADRRSDLLDLRLAELAKDRDHGLEKNRTH